MGYSAKPNRSWFKFGFPIAYVTDVLQNLEVLTALGYADDPRLENALTLLLSKQDADGRWPLEYTYNGKTWVDIEAKGQPSKWVTLRALRVLNSGIGTVESSPVLKKLLTPGGGQGISTHSVYPCFSTR